MKIQMFANAPFQIYAEISTRVKSTNLISTTQYLPNINRFISEGKLGKFAEYLSHRRFSRSSKFYDKYQNLMQL